MAAIEKVLCGIWCTLKTAVSMQGVEQMKLDPDLKDPSVMARLTMENEIFKSHWKWINSKFLPDDSAATGFPPPALTVANLISPANLGDVGKTIAQLAAKLLPAAGPVGAVAATALDALGVTTPPAAPAAPK